MCFRPISALTAAAVMTAGLMAACSAALAEADYQPVPSKGTTFEEKNGYWTECRVTGLGTVCETIYAKAENGKMDAVPVAKGNITLKQGQVLVCYDGSHNAQVCYWAYSPRKSQ